MAMRELPADSVGEYGAAKPVLLVGLGAGLFLGILGPFGTYESLYLGWRLIYWVSLMLGGTLFFPVAYLVSRHYGRARGISPWIYVPVTVALGAVPMMAMVSGVTSMMFGGRMDFDLGNYLRVYAVSLPMVCLHHAISEWKRGKVATTPPPPQPIEAPPPAAAAAPLPPRLLKRLPGRLGSEILCLQMEDHYVRVHTALGQEMLLMRMRDAIAELDGLEGLQVHRSWWVAKAAVQNWSRDGKSLTLHLNNKLDVAVARDRAAEVKAAGWLVD
jgi:hypothetical protein